MVTTRVRNLVVGAVPIVALVAVWDLSMRFGGTTWSLFAVPPAKVLAELFALVRSGELLRAILASLARVLSGIALGFAVAVPVGIGIGWFRPVEKALKPLVEVLRPVPMPAWLPLFILLFGIGDRPAVILTGLAVFFPIAVNTWDAVSYTNRVHVRVAQMLGASPGQLVRIVILPSALPGIFTGLRIGVGGAVTMMVVAELLAVRSGIGYMISVAQMQYDMATVMVGIITAAVVGYLLVQLVNVGVYLALPWRRV